VNPYTFLLDTYATERLKTLSVWSHIDQKDLGFRPSPERGRRWAPGPRSGSPERRGST